MARTRFCTEKLKRNSELSKNFSSDRLASLLIEECSDLIQILFRKPAENESLHF